ncbi:MAG: hypothetical protein QW279_12645, partial [Candidatus Jordarchaeaceae archaeon]
PWRPFRDLEEWLEERWPEDWGWDEFRFPKIRAPRMDLYETDGKVIAELELPGIKPDNVEIIWVPEYTMYDFKRIYEVTKNIVEREIGRKEIIMDVTDGTRISAVALQQLAWEYGLRVFYLKGKKDETRKVIWIRE